MTYLAAALFFSLAFLAAAVALHMTVRFHWSEILMALRGELGAVSPEPRRPARAATTRRAAA